MSINLTMAERSLVHTGQRSPFYRELKVKVSKEQWERLARFAVANGFVAPELVRHAINRLLDAEEAEKREALS